ncbi:antirestriction protein [Kocuria sp. WRN011]|uniref:antirestriction protein ArdA n=1 Tax=Kocuria sp. WRN011 TaxID=2029858 RepID=UPI000BAF064F|nr:antirestriction protein ArdA [Kocuria sp. WRN011]PBB08163.1 antirestriction protein [Kocuria sp. WRN011]
MATNTLDSTPRVWVGCLHCYNAGRLVGEWFDAVDADEVTLTDVHRGAGGARGGCEELWCFDHENLPVRGEMSPHEAAEWGGSLASVPEHQREALCAWVRSGDYVAEGTGDLPSIPDFEDRYCGEWESFREYAEELADGTGLLSGVPDDVARYFDWSAWTRDLAFDYTVEDAPGGGVFVFRNL